MKLKLLPLNKEHLEFVREVRNDPRVNKYLFTDIHISKEDQKKWYRKLLEDKKYFVFIAFDDVPVGYGQVKNIDYVTRSCELGFCIAPEYQGKGYGAMLIKELTEYVVRELDMRCLYLEAFADNKKGIKLYEKCGFRKEKILHDKIFKDGNFKDVVIMSVIREKDDNRRVLLKLGRVSFFTRKC